MNVDKQRTLQGVHQGRRLVLGKIGGKIQTATVWSGILTLARNQLPHSLVAVVGGRWLVGAEWWREFPAGHVVDQKAIYLYPDTLANAVSRPVRRWLMPERFLWRWLIEKRAVGT